MIYTLTLNPAIDKTLELKSLEIGKLNRIFKSRKDASGKGINVSKVIHSLGGKSVAMGFLGGSNGQFIRERLKTLGIAESFITIEGETRVNTKVFDRSTKEITEFNENGPNIKKSELKVMLETLKNTIQADDYLIISGSAPSKIESNIYQKIIQMLSNGTKVILDADGELLKKGIKAKPYLIKPNIYELQNLAGKKLESYPEIEKAVQEILKQGINAILVTMGAKGAYYFEKRFKYRLDPVDVEVKSTTGAGDAMIGGLVYTLYNKESIFRSLKKATACAAASVTMEGTQPGPKELVEKLEEKVQIKEI